jgi:hypothetical protein
VTSFGRSWASTLPDTTIGEVLKAEEQAVEEARHRGLIGPDTQEKTMPNERLPIP